MSCSYWSATKDGKVGSDADGLYMKPFHEKVNATEWRASIMKIKGGGLNTTYCRNVFKWTQVFTGIQYVSP